jgi:hypothetical protein
VAFGDTAGSSKYISENNITRFLLVKKRGLKVSFEEKIKNIDGL